MTFFAHLDDDGDRSGDVQFQNPMNVKCVECVIKMNKQKTVL